MEVWKSSKIKMTCIRKVGDAVDLLEAQRRIEMCIAEIKAWMVMFMDVKVKWR